MFIGNVEIKSMLALAPMAGAADMAFRTVCREMGAGFTCSEMVSSRALVYQDKKTLALLEMEESPCAVQLFGNDPKVMAEAAKKAAEISGADIIDINMGCPMPKIVNNGDGCALMRNIPLAAEIVSAVKGAVKIPVTAKFRLGWDRGSVNASEFAAALEKAGADGVCVHGRTRAQLYGGEANWEAVRDVKKALANIPLTANGDIRSPETAKKCLRITGADCLMVGRASFGDPFIFRELKAALEGGEIPPPPSLEEKCDTAVRQFEISKKQLGEKIACLQARKHYAWYLRGVPYAGIYKEQVAKVCTMDDIYSVTKNILRDLR